VEELTADPPPPKVPAPTTTRRVWARRIATWLVSIAALGFVVWIVPFRDHCTAAGCEDGLFTTLGSANVPLLLALFALHLAGTLAWSARWRALLTLAEARVPLREAWRITLEAQAGGILLPGVGGDALRVAYARTRVPDAALAKILASVFTDRVIGLVTLAALATACALGTGARELGPSLPILAAIPLGAALGWAVIRQPLIARSRLLTGRGIVGRVARPVLEYANAKGGPRAVVHGLLLSLVVSAVQLLVVRGLIAALGVSPDREAWVYVGTTFAMIVGALPLAPGGLGTADAAFVFFFGQAGIAPTVAASMCMLYRVFWYATGVIGAGSALVRRR
jgi:uncharacterized membrane protein YbhN (UPF0104 family)